MSIMKKRILVISTIVLALFYTSSCNPNSSGDKSAISADSSTIALGEASFNQYCSGCHNFKQDGIGPQLAGLTTEVSADWIRHFIKNPKQIISSGDERAGELFKKFKAVMPSFDSLQDDKLNAVIAFMHTHKSSPRQPAKDHGKQVVNLIPDSIRPSSLVVKLKLLHKCRLQVIAVNCL